MTVTWLLDHIVFGANDLDALVASVARRTGITASPGGRQPRYGTRNALVGVGEELYVELIGPDPERERESDFSRRFLALGEPAVTGWCIRTDDLLATRDVLASLDIPSEGPSVISRTTPDGSAVTFEVLRPTSEEMGEAMPFFIDWHDTPHPASVAIGGGRLTHFEVRSPHAALLRDMCSRMRIGSVSLTDADQTGFAGIVAGPGGDIAIGG